MEEIETYTGLWYHPYERRVPDDINGIETYEVLLAVIGEGGDRIPGSGYTILNRDIYADILNWEYRCYLALKQRVKGMR